MRLLLNWAGGLSMGLLAAGAAAQTGSAPRWDEVYRDERSTVHVDLASVEREGRIVTLRSRSDLNVEMDDGVKQIFVRFRYDCSARTSDLLWVGLVASDGRTVSDSVVQPADRRAEPVPSDSPNEAILTRFCA